MADGLLGKCKECTRNDVNENRRKNIERYRAYDRRRFQEDPKRRASTLSRPSPSNSEAKKEWNRNRDPERKNAYYTFSNAVRDGRIVRQPCEVCGKPGAQGHHDDYSKPLDVRWLCSTHHAEHHRVEREMMRQA
jgi:hypothetical protein